MDGPLGDLPHEAGVKTLGLQLWSMSDSDWYKSILMLSMNSALKKKGKKGKGKHIQLARGLVCVNSAKEEQRFAI